MLTFYNIFLIKHYYGIVFKSQLFSLEKISKVKASLFIIIGLAYLENNKNYPPNIGKS